ncbi:MAG: penicillin-binding protein 1C [Spirochaetales bacterium]|nr:penicillin-binding protein 1C [Spirochaetales bacterium]
MRARKPFLFAWAAVELLLIVLFISRPAEGILHNVPFSRVILDDSGRPLRVFLASDERYRYYEHPASFPPEMLEAILLYEDRHFYQHAGFNPVALVEAAWDTYIKKERRYGASTITMQVARLRYRLYTRSVPGKLLQIILAGYLEMLYSKQQILEAYLNLVPCGKNIEGFAAAALFYFDKKVNELTFSEQLLLAVIPQDPGARAPVENCITAELLAAREKLCESWLHSHSEADAKQPEIDLPLQLNNQMPFRAPHVCERLDQMLPKRKEAVRSTINLSLQTLLENHISYYIDMKTSFGVHNAAAMLVDFTNMHVLASVGSAAYFNDAIQGQVNGTTARRSPGSTLKPFIYGLAIDQGLIIPETMLKDAPTSFSEYTPDNYRGDFKGAIPAWKALVDSRNIPAITLANSLRDPDLYEFMQNSGVSGMKERGSYGLSIVLGSAEVSMEELVRMYSLLPNRGTQHELEYVLREEPGTPPGKPLLSPAAAYIVLEMLKGNPSPFEYRPLITKSVPVAFKTGTSIGFKDAWSIAVFDRYILCVWIGNFDGSGNNAYLGRSMATPLLFSIIDELLSRQNRFLPEQPMPAEVRFVDVCSVSGALPNEHCPRTVRSLFIPGVSPIRKCDIHREIFVDTRSGYRTDRREGPHLKRFVREFWPYDLLELFREAGLPRIIPPPYPPADYLPSAPDRGFPPEIISPFDNTVYYLRKGRPEKNRIPLQASVDADTTELFWFADSRFIGKTVPSRTITWSPEPGKYSVTVLDSVGRSDSVEIKVDWDRQEEH